MRDLAQRLADAGIEVKPLEWCDWRANCVFGDYVIDSGQASGGGRWWAWALNPDQSDPFFMYQNSERAETLDAAKSAAQADYETRILAALQVKEGRE